MLNHRTRARLQKESKRNWKSPALSFFPQHLLLIPLARCHTPHSSTQTEREQRGKHTGHRDRLSEKEVTDARGPSEKAVSPASAGSTVARTGGQSENEKGSLSSNLHLQSPSLPPSVSPKDRSPAPRSSSGYSPQGLGGKSGDMRPGGRGSY